MASSATQPSSLDGAAKMAEVGTIDKPKKPQGYGSGPGVIDETTRVVDHKAERRLCRRFDFRLLPVLAIMCQYPAARGGMATVAKPSQIFSMPSTRVIWEMQRPME